MTSIAVYREYRECREPAATCYAKLPRFKKSLWAFLKNGSIGNGILEYWKNG